jgi:predicted membrane-bound spermidine synthase
MVTLSSSQPAEMPATASNSIKPRKLRLYYLLFFFSGFPALLYQIVWQRALFTLYGVNIESVTMIVTVFMLGLGLGSLAGGWLSARSRIRLLVAFGGIELSIGVFGVASLRIFHLVGAFTAGRSTLETGLVSFALLLLPTLLMGSTLPLLVEYFVRRTGNVAESVSALYSVNTFGSGVACLAAALFLMRIFGESGAMRVAACFNFLVGMTALALQMGDGAPAPMEKLPDATSEPETIPFWIGMLLAGVTGFIALAYEIIWYRLYSFASGGAAACFAGLLAFYLFGIACGSLMVYDACQRKMRNDVHRILQTCARVVVLGTIASFLLGPTLARSIVHVPYVLTFGFVFIAAGLLGSAFPLLAEAAVGSGAGAGKRIGFLYLSNIVGSTLGSFLIGFVVLNYWSTRATSLLLLSLGLIAAIALAVLSGPKSRKGVFAFGCAGCIAAALCSGPLFSSMYERLLYKSAYQSSMKFADVVENRSGVIAVDSADIVYGGGVYDGRFNTDLVHDSNGLIRAFAVSNLRPGPKNILVIGLSSGSWAQVVANDPDVEDEMVIEINPGYQPLIRKHADVASLLRNPKVHIVIDDGRRWLVSHPNRKFDFILMNTSFNWRANTTNLLSTEFLGIIRAHLNPGGVAYYNTTSSERVLVTGSTEFPYALRIFNFLAVSDTPLTLDEDIWKAKLTSYRIDGRPVFDLANQPDRDALNRILHLDDAIGTSRGMVESRTSMLHRFHSFQLITDDNMGTEWQ